MSFTRAEKLACVQREIKQRERVYPRLVEKADMSAAFAREQIACMKEIAADLERLLLADPPPAQGGLFGGKP